MKILSTFTAGLATVFYPTMAMAVDWNMPTPFTDVVFQTQNIRLFAEDVKRLTDGNFNITVHSGNSLFGHGEIRDAVRQGVVPIGEILMSNLTNENPIFGIDTIPFLVNNYEQSDTLWEVTRPSIEEKFLDQGLTILFSVPFPGNGIYTIEKVDDISSFRGLSMRAYSPITEQLAAGLGAVPVQIDSGDISTAFNTGRINAMVTSSSTGAEAQAWEFVNHFIDAQAWFPRNVVFVNTAALNALPEEHRDAILTAAEEAQARGRAMSQEDDSKNKERLTQNGIEISLPNETMKDNFSEIGTAILNSWMDTAGQDDSGIIEDYFDAISNK